MLYIIYDILYIYIIYIYIGEDPHGPPKTPQGPPEDPQEPPLGPPKDPPGSPKVPHGPPKAPPGSPRTPNTKNTIKRPSKARKDAPEAIKPDLAGERKAQFGSNVTMRPSAAICWS